MNSGKGNIILLTILEVAVLLVAVAGATFAYFSATMSNGTSSNTIEVTNGKLIAQFNGDSKVSAGYVNGGEVLVQKEFSITGMVTGSNNLNYEPTMVISENNYADNELVYTITSVNESNNGTVIASSQTPVGIPTGANTISFGKGVFAGPTTSGLIHKYVLTITRQTQNDQDQNKVFNAELYVM